MTRPEESEKSAREIPPGALKNLSKGERAVLMKLAENPEAGYEEIGSQMGLSQEGVKSSIKRARMKIKAFLNKRGL